MQKSEIITQNILNPKGEIVENNVFSLETLNAKIIPAAVLKDNAQERWKNSISANLNMNNLYIQKNNAIIYEEWKKYPLVSTSKRRGKYKEIETLEISNLGRVKINNAIMTQEDKKGFVGYLMVKNYPALGMVWNLVASTWLEKPKVEDTVHVHHITNNGYDNSVLNLIWLDRQTHAKINHRGKLQT